MKKARKYLSVLAVILFVLWVLSTLLTKCGDMQISYDIVDTEDDIIATLEKAAVKSRDISYPNYLVQLIDDIENDTTYSNQKHFFLELNDRIFLSFTYVKSSKRIVLDSMSDYIWPLERIVTFQHPRVSAVKIIKSINEFKRSVLKKNNIEYSENWFNYISIYMAFFDDYQGYLLLLIISLMYMYIDSIKYEQHIKEHAVEQE